ncbi:MAG: pilus assembly protein PilY, partial [Cycloclasticus sp.]|nr:pilus assembly protein PilY [Cycloclasticus sp.]
MLRIQLSALALVSILAASTTHATNLNLSPVPLFLGGAVEPNIMFTLDDSGSMHWENMPDDNWTFFIYPRANNVYGPSNYGNFVPVFSDITYSVRIRSGDINKVYYNPSTVYRPWSNATGISMGDVDVTCAPHNPFDTAKGCRDLTVNNIETANWETYNGDGTTFPGSVTTESNVSKTFWPAVYYNYQGGDPWTVANYQKIEIMPATATYTTSASRTNCATAPICTYAEEIQNFANWYSYYRSRVLTARAGIGRAFANQGTNIRVGFAALNVGSRTIDGVT